MKSLLNLIFPRFCLGCSYQGKYICERCFHNKLKLNLSQKCHVCGRETRLGFAHKECEELSYLDGVIHLVDYNGFAEQILFQMKYQSVSQIADELGSFMVDNLFQLYNLENYILTYVPSHKSRMRERGYNQAELLAKSIGCSSGVIHYETLQRVRNTKNQVGMKASERENNLRGSIKLKEGTSIVGQQIILIDDVYTTGATMNECAKVLKKSGVEKVVGCVFAKTVG